MFLDFLFPLKALNGHQLAHALVEHETLDSDEVKKVIRGEPIRNITDVLDEELSNMPASAGAPGV
jgi:ATP-dependent metalloprotease